MIQKTTIFIWVRILSLTQFHETYAVNFKDKICMRSVTKYRILISVFELLERGEVLTVPTDTPLDEKTAWLAFRDVILGLEYREYI